MSRIAAETLRSNVRIAEGKITVSDKEDEASLYFDTERIPPLSRDETHVTLRVEADGFTAKIELDGYHIDGLADRLDDYQEELRDHK